MSGSSHLDNELRSGSRNKPPKPSCPLANPLDADFDQDGDIDTRDFIYFQRNWTGAVG